MSILWSFLSFVLLLNLTQAQIDYRLSDNVKPRHYNIMLAPNIDAGDFYGESSINITVMENDTKTITLHAKNLNIVKELTTLIDANDIHVKPANHKIDNVTDFFTLHFTENPLDAGEYVLNLEYSGKLNNEPKGFYRRSYTNDNGQQTWLAATNLAPIYARQAFPCFDEPHLKAKFEITIEHYNNCSVLSNMPVSNEVQDVTNPRKLHTTFKVTPVMSTYSVAFVISNLKNATSDNGRFTIWCRESYISKTNYALGVGQQALELLKRYTVFEHVIPKMDYVVIPESHIVPTNGWGLIINGENAMAYEGNVTTTSAKQDIAMSIVRQLAYQWFGNLVSPKWWDDTWVIEGLATYFQYYITDKIETDWRMMDQFVVRELQEKAFSAEDNGVQRSLRSTVRSPEEIVNNFDVITSSKAACIIRMFDHTIGAKSFRTGLKKYMRENAYNSADALNLRQGLSSVKGVPSQFDTVFNTWMGHVRYPVIYVRRFTDRDWDMRQSLYIPERTYNKDNKIVWSILIHYSVQESGVFTYWLDRTQTPYQRKIDYNKLIILNTKQQGYYRVDYRFGDYWDLISNYLNTHDYVEIHLLNRAQLLDDSFHLVESGYHYDYRNFLTITRYLQKEVDYIPWYSAFRAFSKLNMALMHTEHYDLFKLYILRLMEKLEMIVGYSEMVDDGHITKLQRIKVVEWACKMGSVNCTRATHEMFMQHLNGSSSISPDLLDVVLCAGIRTANASVWERTFRLYEGTNNENERRAIMNALGCSSDSEILKSYLMKSADPSSGISLEFAIRSIIDNSERGVDVAMDFVENNLATIIKTVADNETILRCSNYIGSRMFNEDQMEKLELFSNSLLADNKNLADYIRNNAITSVISNIEWVENYVGIFHSFLRDQKLLGQDTIVP